MRKFTVGVVSLLIASSLLMAAQEMGESVGIQVSEHETHGAYLTDAEGRSLYLFLNDRMSEEGEVYPAGAEPAPSTCYEQCAENWPPFITEVWPLPEGSVGEGVDASLLNVTEREDGTLQLAYAGWPLYYFIRDENPGDINGQDVGEVWYLISPEGVAVGREEEAAEPAEEAEEAEPAGEEGEMAEEQHEEVFAELMSEGEEVYTRITSPPCASCHGQAGEGIAAPGLVGSRIVENTDRLIRLILRGGNFMPAFGGQLSDRQVAAVATFVRNSWGNDHGLVTEEEVSEAR